MSRSLARRRERNEVCQVGALKRSAKNRDARQPELSTQARVRDRELIKAVRSFDSSAQRRLHDVLRPTVERSLRRILPGKPMEFEDLCQDTFERIIRSIADGRFNGGSLLSTWAYAIAQHVALDWLRRTATEQRYLDALALELPPICYSLERQLEARAEVRRVQGILQRMKSLNASALVLHDVYRYSEGEVAESLGLGLSAASSRLRRARRELARRNEKTIALREPSLGRRHRADGLADSAPESRHATAAE